MINFKISHRLTPIVVLFGLMASFGAAAAQNTVAVTLLHTNDVHSHFRPESGPLGLGGVARLKTAIDRIRNETSNTLLVDGGDWSEGSIYYYEGAGVESVKMMDHLGYDVAVVGNHDWLNGPDALMKVFQQVQPKTTFVSANLSPEEYAREQEFRKWVLPYTIRKVGGIKIAFIGLSTYEFIYDKFISPVKVTEPFLKTRKLAAKLKEEADVVVVISHNSVMINKGILKAAPDVDFVVGAHDHVKLTKPVRVERSGETPGWIFETGSWGKYLGRINFEVTAKKVHISPNQQFLIQMDANVPEDPKTLEIVENLEDRIEKRYGPIFHDHVGDSELELNRMGVENGMGNLVTDAYRQASHADLSIDSTKFIYGEVHEGALRTVDVINAIPAVYDPITQKSWTMKTVSFSGRTLKWLMYGIFATKKLSSYGLVSISGMSFTYDPLFLQYNSEPDLNLLANNELQNLFMEPASIPVVKDIRIQGQPLDVNRKYRVALGNGLIESVHFLNSKLADLIHMDDIRDSGLENWRVVSDYIRARTPLTREKVTVGDRIRTLQPSLGIYYEDLKWEPILKASNGMVAKIRVRVKNFGVNPSSAGSAAGGAWVHILSNRNGMDYSVDPEYREVGAGQYIPALASGEAREFVWEIKVPEYKGFYPLTAKIEGSESDVNHTNVEVTRLFSDTGSGL